MTHWFTGKFAYLSTRLGVQAGCLAAGILPRRWLFGISDWLATIGYRLFRRFRNKSVFNLGVALGAQLDGTAIERIVRRSLRNFFRSCVEIGITLESSDADLRSEIPISGRENLDAALAQGRGVIALSAHLGNFFIVGTRLTIAGYSTFVLVNQPRDGHFAKLMDDFRLRARQNTIHARPRREALEELYEVLRGNGVAVMIADEYRKGNGIHVPLFGHTVLARRGPATIALRTGAQIVPVLMVRQPDDSLKLVIEPPLELLRSAKGRAEIRENTLRITQWLERTVRAYPDQWNWMNIQWSNSSQDPLLTKEEREQRTSYEILD